MLVSVYIRKADEQLWKELPKKTQAIHDLLRGETRRLAHLENQLSRVETRIVDDIVDAPRILPKEFEPRFCKNGHPIPYPKDKCLGKGCQYS